MFTKYSYVPGIVEYLLYPFTDEETEAQWGEVGCLVKHSCRAAELRLESLLCCLNSHPEVLLT